MKPAFAACFSAVLLAGCSTVDSRIEKQRAAFESLPPAQQRLVRRGEIREGMNENAVSMAWGRPDEKTTGSANGRGFKVWIYYRYRSEPVADFGYTPRRIGRRYYGEAIYHPRYTTQVDLDRRAVFENGKVVGWELASW